jgi:hypothetical protein
MSAAIKASGLESLAIKAWLEKSVKSVKKTADYRDWRYGLIAAIILGSAEIRP